SVVDALETVALDARERERRAAVRAQLVEEADPTVLGAKGHVALAEQADRQWPVAMDEVRGERERDPRVLAHEPTHRRVTLDAGHELVLGLRDHRTHSVVTDATRAFGAGLG